MPRVESINFRMTLDVWIFPAERSLSEAEQGQLLAVVDQFIDQWGCADAVPLTASAGNALRPVLVCHDVDQRQAPDPQARIDRRTVSAKQGFWTQQMGVELADHAPVLVQTRIHHRAACPRPVCDARRSGQLPSIVDATVGRPGQHADDRRDGASAAASCWETRYGSGRESPGTPTRLLLARRPLWLRLTPPRRSSRPRTPGTVPYCRAEGERHVTWDDASTRPAA